MQQMLRQRDRADRMIGRRQTRRELTAARQMWLLLERYRGRADRSGQEFSVAVFRTDGSDRTARRMARQIAGRVRLSDEVGWLEGASVCAILPDTAAQGAACFAADVVRLVEPRCGRVRFTLYTYPTEPADLDRDDSGRIDKNLTNATLRAESVAFCQSRSARTSRKQDFEIAPSILPWHDPPA